MTPATPTIICLTALITLAAAYTVSAPRQRPPDGAVMGDVEPWFLARAHLLSRRENLLVGVILVLIALCFLALPILVLAQ